MSEETNIEETTEEQVVESLPIVVTLTIPTDGSGVADLVAEKGSQAVFRQTGFADAEDLANAILGAAWDVTEQELEPPFIAVPTE